LIRLREVRHPAVWRRWPQHSVLVVAIETGQRCEAVVQRLALAVDVRLVSPECCPVCSRQEVRDDEMRVEGFLSQGEREVDAGLLFGQHGALPARRNERPSQVVEGRAEVVSGVPDQQSQPWMKRLGAIDKEPHTVVLGVVFSARRPGPLSLELLKLAPEFAVESLCMDYGAAPFEPRAVEGVIHAR
jgi:hypothetical protein